MYGPVYVHMVCLNWWRWQHCGLYAYIRNRMDLDLRYAFMHCMFSDYHNLDNPTNKNMNGAVCLLWAYILSMWSSTIPFFSPSHKCGRIVRAMCSCVCGYVFVWSVSISWYIIHALHGKCLAGWLVGRLPSVVSGLIYFLRIFLSSGLNLHRYFIFVYGQARFNLGLSHSFSVIKFISPTIFFKSTISCCCCGPLLRLFFLPVLSLSPVANLSHAFHSSSSSTSSWAHIIAYLGQMGSIKAYLNGDGQNIDHNYGHFVVFVLFPPSLYLSQWVFFWSYTVLLFIAIALWQVACARQN